MIEIDASIPKMSASGDVSPTVLRCDDTLLLAYFGDGGEVPVVLAFERVVDWHYGYPNDEDLECHPLFGHGLQPYECHVAPAGNSGVRAWVMTFHEGTLMVYASSMKVVDAHHRGDPASALRSIEGAGTIVDLDAIEGV